jgi:hypothetical protein
MALIRDPLVILDLKFRPARAATTGKFSFAQQRGSLPIHVLIASKNPPR